MKRFVISTAGFAALATAQRPEGTSICDFYTNALFDSSTAEDQYGLVTAVVNTAVIGNYTEPNQLAVPGILAPGEYNGTQVNLLQYFNGDLASTNTGGDAGESVNFLDDGGAEPLTMNMPASGTDSRQFRLMTHLYQYFGALLGCSQYGSDGFEQYAGNTNMYEVHKYMGLDTSEMSYFIVQVGLAAASSGVAEEDVREVVIALTSLFNQRCSAPTAVLPDAEPELQAMCIANDCPLAPNATCAAYDPAVEPTGGSNATTGGNATATNTMSMTGTPSPTGTASDDDEDLDGPEAGGSNGAGRRYGEAGSLLVGALAAAAMAL